MEEEEEDEVKPVMKSVIKKGEYSEKSVSELLLHIFRQFFLLVRWIFSFSLFVLHIFFD